MLIRTNIKVFKNDRINSHMFINRYNWYYHFPTLNQSNHEERVVHS